jgi:RNA polymerase sigma-70 factor (ECF subfamily)
MDRRNDTVTVHATIPPDLLLAHAGALRALALSLVGDEHAAEDVLQETFVRALRSPPSSHERIGGWLRRVVEGFAHKRRRSEDRRAAREKLYARERPESVIDSRALADSRGETLRAVVEAVLSLEEPYRETVLLRWFEGLPPRVIAEQAHVSVATVNSRLQRAHAILREKLERRLRDRAGGFHAAVLALIGTRDVAASSSSATTISLAGLVVSSTAKLIACAAIAAAIVVSVLLVRSSRMEPLGPPEVSVSSRTTLEAPLESPPATSSVVATSARTSVSSEIVAERVESPPVPGAFAFDVTFQPVDALGLPVPDVDIDLGPDHHPLNRVGRSAWNGELHTTWRGTERAFDGVLRATTYGFAWMTPLVHVHIVAGAPRTLRFLVERSGKHELRGLGYTDGERLDQNRAESSALPAFTLDAAGNGVFVDWALAAHLRTLEAGSAALGHSRPFTTRKLGGPGARGSGKRGPRASVQVSVTDEHGAALADVPLCALVKPDGRRRDARTDVLGHCAFDDLPPGAVQLWSGGPEHTYQHESIELVDGQVHSWDIQLGQMPMAGGRLVDASGTALAGYCVEARADPNQLLFIGCARTDDSGRFRLSFPMAGKARLCVWPGDDLRCALVASDGFSASMEDRDTVARDVGERASLGFDIELARDLVDSDVEARLFRVDSGEGLYLLPSDGGHSSTDANTTRRAFHAERLLPGDYALEVLAPGGGRSHKKTITLRAGESVNLGLLAIEPGGRVDVRVPATGKLAESKVTVVMHDRGVTVISGELALAGSFLVPPGHMELRITSASEDDRPALLRDLNVASNATIELVVPERPR